MSTISTLLANILSKKKGEEVRQYIHDAIAQCYSDVNTPSLITEGLDTLIQGYIDNGTISGAIMEDLGLITEGTSNLFDFADLDTGLLSTSGVLDTTNTGYVTSDYIAVTANTAYYFASVYRRVFYDSNNTFVSYANSPSSFTPSADGFIRVSVTNANRQTAKINEGTNQAYRPGRSAIDFNLRDNTYTKTEVDQMIAGVDVSLTQAQIDALVALLD